MERQSGMAEPSFNDLGVTAQTVANVEDAVLADAQAKAAAAEREHFGQALATANDQIKTLRSERTSLQRQSVRPSSTKLSALQKRIDNALLRRQRLIDANDERNRLANPGLPSAAPADTPADGESHRDFLIRTGKLTPFQGQEGYERRQTASKTLQRSCVQSNAHPASTSDAHNRILSNNGVNDDDMHGDSTGKDVDDNDETPFSTVKQSSRSSISSGKEKIPSSTLKRSRSTGTSADDDEYVPDRSSDLSEEDEEIDDDFELGRSSSLRSRALKKQRKSSSSVASDHAAGSSRPSSHTDHLDGLSHETGEAGDVVVDEKDGEEFEGGLRIPASIFDRLFSYQKTGVSHSLFTLLVVC